MKLAFTHSMFNRKTRRAMAALGLAAALTLGSTAHAASILSAGDIAFVRALSDAPDDFSFVLLRDVEAGTYIRLTDNAWDTGSNWREVAGSSFRMTENSITWQAGTNLSAGTVVSFTGTALAFAGTGDNIIATQGTWHSPTFLAALQFATASDWRTTGAATTNDSYLPTGLTDGTDAVSLQANGDLDNAVYSGTTSGTTAAIRTAVNTQTNWSESDTTLFTAPGTFTISDATAAADQTSTIAIYEFGTAAASYTTAATKIEGTLGNQVTFGTFGTVQGTPIADANGKDGYDNQGFATENNDTAYSTAATVNLATDVAHGFSLTIASGYQYDLEQISYYALASDGDGPERSGLYISTDGGTNWAQLGSDLNVLDNNWEFANYNDIASTLYTGTLLFRIYAWDAVLNNNQGFSIDEVFIRGTISEIPEVVIPEPASLALLAAGGLMIAGRRKLA